MSFDNLGLTAELRLRRELPLDPINGFEIRDGCVPHPEPRRYTGPPPSHVGNRRVGHARRSPEAGVRRIPPADDAGASSPQNSPDPASGPATTVV